MKQTLEERISAIKRTDKLPHPNSPEAMVSGLKIALESIEIIEMQQAEIEKLRGKLEDNFRCKHDYCLQERGENSCGIISQYKCSICGEETKTLQLFNN